LQRHHKFQISRFFTRLNDVRNDVTVLNDDFTVLSKYFTVLETYFTVLDTDFTVLETHVLVLATDLITSKASVLELNLMVSTHCTDFELIFQCLAIIINTNI
jgi:hypothetical protein